MRSGHVVADSGFFVTRLGFRLLMSIPRNGQRSSRIRRPIERRLFIQRHISNADSRRKRNLIEQGPRPACVAWQVHTVGPKSIPSNPAISAVSSAPAKPADIIRPTKPTKRSSALALPRSGWRRIRYQGTAMKGNKMMPILRPSERRRPVASRSRQYHRKMQKLDRRFSTSSAANGANSSIDVLKKKTPSSAYLACTALTGGASGGATAVSMAALISAP